MNSGAANNSSTTYPFARIWLVFCCNIGALHQARTSTATSIIYGLLAANPYQPPTVHRSRAGRKRTLSPREEQGGEVSRGPPLTTAPRGLHNIYCKFFACPFSVPGTFTSGPFSSVAFFYFNYSNQRPPLRTNN